MRCAEFEGLWLAGEEGVLGRSDRERLRRHLEQCPACAALVQELGILEQQLEALGEAEPTPSPYLKTRVLARLEERERARPRAGLLRGLFSSRRLLAVSTACLAFFAGLLVRELRTLNQLTARSSTQPVVLEFQGAGADDVQLVGDFNDWGRQALPIQADRQNGRWVFRMELEPGRYQYAFLVDGKQWLPDPDAPGIIPDGFGGENSLLYVTESRQRESL